MKKFTCIFILFGLLIGGKKNTGLFLWQDGSTLIIPYKQVIEITLKNGKTVKKGILFNVSLNTIYLKSLSSDETIAIPSNRVFSIKAKARTQNMKDFGQGCGTGALVGIGLGTIVTFQQYLQRRELMTIFIGSIFFTPIVTLIGGVGGGLLHMSNQQIQVKNIDTFLIDKNNWRIV